MSFAMESICRTCMNEDLNMISLFDPLKKLADILMSCSTIKINEKDGLPSFICQNCVKQLTSAFNFKRQCEEVDVTLHEIIINPNIEYVKVEYDEEEYSESENFVPADIFDNKSNIKCNDIEHEYMKVPKIDVNIVDNKDKLVHSEKAVPAHILDNKSNIEFIDVEQGYSQVIKINTENKIDVNNTCNKDKLVQVKSEAIAVESQPHTVYVCQYCLMLFQDYDKFELHKSAPCVIKVQYAIDNNKSEKSAIRSKTHKCKSCNLVLSTKEDYLSHRKAHVISKQHKCTSCDRCFGSAYGLKYHKMIIHSKIERLKCSYENCNKTYVKKDTLQKHLNTHSNDINKNKLCDLCGKMCTVDSYYYHIKTHGGTRPHLCVECGRTFKQMSHLNDHMWIHNGVKNHTCEICKKCFTRGHQLRKHKRKFHSNLATKTN